MIRLTLRASFSSYHMKDSFYSISRNTSGATGGDRRNFTHDVTATTKEHANSADACVTAFGLSP
jgi:hypothetical protein